MNPPRKIHPVRALSKTVLLRDWVSIVEAAELLSSELDSEVRESDLISLALEEKLELCIYLSRQYGARLCSINPDRSADCLGNVYKVEPSGRITLIANRISAQELLSGTLKNLDIRSPLRGQRWMDVAGHYFVRYSMRAELLQKSTTFFPIKVPVFIKGLYGLPIIGEARFKLEALLALDAPSVPEGLTNSRPMPEDLEHFTLLRDLKTPELFYEPFIERKVASSETEYVPLEVFPPEYKLAITTSTLKAFLQNHGTQKTREGAIHAINEDVKEIVAAIPRQAQEGVGEHGAIQRDQWYSEMTRERLISPTPISHFAAAKAVALRYGKATGTVANVKPSDRGTYEKLIDVTRKKVHG